MFVAVYTLSLRASRRLRSVENLAIIQAMIDRAIHGSIGRLTASTDPSAPDRTFVHAFLRGIADADGSGEIEITNANTDSIT